MKRVCALQQRQGGRREGSGEQRAAAPPTGTGPWPPLVSEDAVTHDALGDQG
jgi:hypothetical protein